MSNQIPALNTQQQKDKFQYNPAFSFQGDSSNEDQTRQDELKNEYSTFIQQLQQTTQKLMNEVFNSQYKPHMEDYFQDPNNKKVAKKIVQNKRQNKINTNVHKYSSRNLIGFRNLDIPAESNQNFKDFLVRNNKWCEKKQKNIIKQQRKKQILQKKEVTGVPQILRGSLEKLQPIYERALQIHASKQKKVAYKKIELKKRQDEQLNKLPFHPQINQKSKARTLQQYLKDKQEWERKKKEVREQKKLIKQSQQLFECSFKPALISKQIEANNSRIRIGEKVQQRLLRSLEKQVNMI